MLNITSRVKYGLRSLIMMADEKENKRLPLAAIAESENISVKYLENIFNLLKKASIVKSVRGPEGGYFLAREPNAITMYSIMAALDGPINIADCMDKQSCCGRMEDCISKHFWQKLQKHIRHYLESITLQQVLDQGIESIDLLKEQN